MNYRFQEISYKSTDGRSTVYAELYIPRTAEVKGIVQLAHGMADYVGRYTELADYLCSEGYVFAGNHHLGHGKTAGTPDEFGYFAERDGVTCLLRDMHTMNRYLRESFPALPVILLGHSMGSFLARLYVNRYPHSIKGVIIHGTAGKNPLTAMGRGVAALVSLFKGGRHRSPLLDTLAFGSYNKKFDKSEGKYAWLSRDNDKIKGKGDDPSASFIFTASGFSDLFRMLDACNSRAWYKAYPKELPTLVISGDCDPVGSFGRGHAEVYKKLLIAGAGKVTCKTYEGARHELFNETCRGEVFEFLAEWIGEICK